MTETSFNVATRIEAIVEYIRDMEHEREGHGAEVQLEAYKTMRSFIYALPIMYRASALWCDGSGFSFAGELETISFGMIARYGKPSREGMLPPVDWTFHS